MDTVMTNLPPKVGTILMENISIIEIVSMFSIGAYNALETGIVTFDVFKHYRGLYFWSMQVASWGILVHAIPAMTRFVSQAPNLPMSILFMIGWYAMVTGQAVVLYSRLHLVVSDMSKVRWVLWMIITNFFILHVPTTVLFFGLNYGGARFARPAAIYERIQVTGFCVQDLVICGIYIHEAGRALKPIIKVRGREGRKVIIHLLWVNILVVFLNILLLLTEYKLHYIQVSFKTVVYSIKLKLEFAVLNRLRSLTRTNPCVCQQEPTQRRRSSDMNLFDIISTPSRVASDVGTPEFAPGGMPYLPSRPSSIHGYHQTLRETANDSSIPSGDISSSPTVSGYHLNRTPGSSSETLSTLELNLPKFSPSFDD
ncbi:hypothetical protein N7510_002693 [Penicillium lagena]|uniref:uncharacterized protein n=1 Tax=Penicillium lagena TaxID=94218 RepID=UPI002540FB9B|nr:uncharacterized protein N7510_002693 [Penicillium lagena]KAJ5626384.1 hypothetical protein N7510_002693 [Penicillium lagena]